MCPMISTDLLVGFILGLALALAGFAIYMEFLTHRKGVAERPQPDPADWWKHGQDPFGNDEE